MMNLEVSIRETFTTPLRALKRASLPKKICDFMLINCQNLQIPLLPLSELCNIHTHTHSVEILLREKCLDSTVSWSTHVDVWFRYAYFNNKHITHPTTFKTIWSIPHYTCTCSRRLFEDIFIMLRNIQIQTYNMSPTVVLSSQRLNNGVSQSIFGFWPLMLSLWA